MRVTEMNLSASSSTRTGALRYSTVFHSSQLSGAVENTSVKSGIYRIAECKTILKIMEPTRNGFFHTGNLNKLSFSDSEFIALNISTVTRTERLMVVAVRDISFVNISQPTSGKSRGHW